MYLFYTHTVTNVSVKLSNIVIWNYWKYASAYVTLMPNYNKKTGQLFCMHALPSKTNVYK